jgi:hypothetical protein
VDGCDEAGRFADALAEAVAATGQDCVRTNGDGGIPAKHVPAVVVTTGRQWGTARPADAVLVWLRSVSSSESARDGHLAQIVVDLRGSGLAGVIRRVGQPGPPDMAAC